MSVYKNQLNIYMEQELKDKLKQWCADRKITLTELFSDFAQALVSGLPYTPPASQRIEPHALDELAKLDIGKLKKAIALVDEHEALLGK